MTSNGALDGIRVVDFGQYLAGPMATMMLADNGADVIHIDPPGGPRWDHPANAALLRNKRSVELDLKTDTGRAVASRLVDSADIVVENFRCGALARLGLTPEAFHESNPGLIWCAMPGFASDDPRAGLPAWEGVVCSAAGLYCTRHFGPGDPLFTALPLASNFAAFTAVHRLAAALVSRLRTGRGQHFELSLFEACFQAIGWFAEIPTTRDLRTRNQADPFFVRLNRLTEPRRAADGQYVYLDTPPRGIQALFDKYLPGFHLLDLDDERFAELDQALDALIATKDAAEWERICQEDLNASAAFAQTAAGWLADDHALHSGSVIEVEDAALGSTRQAGYPARLTATPASLRWGRGAADPANPADIDWLASHRTDPAMPPGPAGLPLEGMRVVDCCTLLAGPTANRILAQYGAEVIKVDRTGLATGDISVLTDDTGAFAGGRTVNAGKRMVFLDLKDADARDILHALLRTTDVIHHNFTPGAAERLGLGPELLKQLNPSIIQSNMSLHTRGGFRGAWRGHDMSAQMITGMSRRMGGDGVPKLMSFVLNDHSAGHLNAFGVLLAILHRNRTGETQTVNSSLSVTSTLHQLPFMISHEGRVWDEPAGPQTRGWNAFDRLYQGADDWFYLSAGRTDPADVVAALDATELGRGLAEVPADAREKWLEQRFAPLTAQECVDALLAAGLAAHRHLRLAEILADEYVRSRGLTTVLDHPGIGRATGIGQPTVHVDGRYGDELAAHRPGLDTVDLLEELGYAAAIPDLIRRGVIGVGENPLVNISTTPGYWRNDSLTPILALEDARRLAEQVVAEPLRPVWLASLKPAQV